MMNDDLTLLLKSHKHRPLAIPRPFHAAEGFVIHTNFCVDCRLVYWTPGVYVEKGFSLQDECFSERLLTKP